MTTITSSTTIGITLSSPSYVNPIVVNPGVTIFNGGNSIYAASGSWTIQNDGVISSTNATGIDIVVSGSVATAFLVVNSGSIAGGVYGVYLGAGGTVTNAASDSITGGLRGVAIGGAAGTVINSGHIGGTG